MSDDWKVGDLALCVDASRRWAGNCCAELLTSGAVYRVSRAGTDCGTPYVTLEAPINPFDRTSGFAADRFRKIRPDEQSGEKQDWIDLLKVHSRPKVRA